MCAIGGCHGDVVDKFKELDGLLSRPMADIAPVPAEKPRKGGHAKKAKLGTRHRVLPFRLQQVSVPVWRWMCNADVLPSCDAASSAEVAGGAVGEGDAAPSPPTPAGSCLSSATCPHLLGIEGCVAFARCTVRSTTVLNGHYLCVCTLDSAAVDANYWNGKLFRPVDATFPPYLTFFGSQEFGYVTS